MIYGTLSPASFEAHPVGAPPLALPVVVEALESANISADVVRATGGARVDYFEFKIKDWQSFKRCRDLVPIIRTKAHAPTMAEAPSVGDFAISTARPEARPLTFSDIGHSLTPGAPRVGVSSALCPIDLNLSRCPHILIAGATGSGKSTLLKTFLASLLCYSFPNLLTVSIIDIKRVEYSPFLPFSAPSRLVNGFDGLPRQFLTLTTDTYKAIAHLSAMVAEMEQRYKAFEALHVSNLDEFNRISSAPMRRIVLIIDELADLMLVSRYEVEEKLVRLAQLGRACGIHLILATQRPTVDVVTGLIKANITTRIALKTASYRDSMTILDTKGAEQLLGLGDGLIRYPDRVEPVRFQTAITRPEELNRILKHYQQYL